MTLQAEAQSAKNKNIIEMALVFTAMTRVFASGSMAKIGERLEVLFGSLVNVGTREEYQTIHRAFCHWFMSEIQTTAKKHASFGQAAKVLDIAIKVYVYYCTQPSGEVSARVLPLLNGAIDTPILKHLKSTGASPTVRAKTIQEVDETAYRALQSFVSTESLSLRVHPVQYDDIMWRRLNR